MATKRATKKAPAKVEQPKKEQPRKPEIKQYPGGTTIKIN